jgi:putative ABC transport system ATP-binding protein
MIEKNTITDQLLTHFSLDDDSMVERTRLTVENYRSIEKLNDPDRQLLVSLFLLVIPERHRFVELDNRSATRIVQARREFKQHLPTELQDAVLYFDINHYHPRLNIKDNLLFGRMSSSNPAEQRAINQLLEQVICKFDLHKDLALLFGESQVGISGSRLPLVARHRIGLGRALMKKPDILIFHDALAPYVAAEQIKRRKAVRKLLPDTTIVWISREIPNPLEFDQVYQFTETGQVIAAGLPGPELNLQPPSDYTNHNSSPTELIANSLLFSELAPDQQQHIAESSKLVTVPGDSCIYEINDEPDSAWLVVTGEVITNRAESNGIQLNGTFHRSEVFGLLDVLADCPRIMSAHTTQDSSLLRIDAEAVESIALSNPQVSRTLLRSLSNQWRH